MTGIIKGYTDPNAFHLKLNELGAKPAGHVYQYVPETGDINAVKSRGRFFSIIGLGTPGTSNQSHSINAIGKLIAKNVLLLDRKRDYNPLLGLRHEIEQLHLTDDPLYYDLNLIIRTIEEDKNPSNSVWDIIPRDLQLKLISRLTPEELQATAKANKDFATKILDPIEDAARILSSKHVQPKLDISKNVDNMMDSGVNLNFIRNVFHPYLEMPAVKNRVETLAANIQAYYKAIGKTQPEQINPKLAGFDWTDLAFLEMKIRGMPIFEAKP